MTTVLTTTGTSIARGCKWEGDEGRYSEAIRERLRGLPKATLLVEASAESNSLSRLSLSSGDRVYLFHTATDTGRLCAGEVKALIESELGLVVRAVEVAGLEMGHPDIFRRRGIHQLFEQLERFRSAAGDEVVLNATGGFKSVVPYVVLFGLLHRLPVVYIFEGSSTLLRLPPAPITYDWAAIRQAEDAIRQLIAQDVMSVDEFFALIPGISFADRDRFAPLIEIDEDQTLVASPFASLMLTDREGSTSSPYLSPAARRTLKNSRGRVGRHFQELVKKVGDPGWRATHRHAFAASELAIFKPGNTSERVGCIEHGRRIYVAELWKHDEYLRKAPGTKVADYDLSTFEPWVPPQGSPSLGLAPTEAEEFRAAERRAELAEEGLASALDDAREAQAMWEEAEARAAAAESVVLKQSREIERLRAEVAALRPAQASLQPTAPPDERSRFRRWLDRVILRR